MSNNNTKDIKIVFDLDDTIYDLSEPFRIVHKELFSDILGENCDELFLKSRIYSDEILAMEWEGKIDPKDTFFFRMKKTYADVNYDMDRKMAAVFEEKYRYYQKHVVVPDGIKKMLDWCNAAGIPIGVLTNGSVKEQGNKFTALELHRWFEQEYLFVSKGIGYWKPDARAFDVVKDVMGGKTENMWYVGDTYEMDVIGAKNAGWNVIWFNHRNREVPGKKNLADMTVHTAEELLEALKGLV